MSPCVNVTTRVFCCHQVQDLLKGDSDADGGKGGRALAVQDVNAPAEYVWDRILDFPSYKKMVGGALRDNDLL